MEERAEGRAVHVAPAKAEAGARFRTGAFRRVLLTVLAYRVVNFWLVLLGGWITMAVLTHPPGKAGKTDP